MGSEYVFNLRMYLSLFVWCERVLSLLALQRFRVSHSSPERSCVERAHTQPTKTVCLVGLALGKKKSQPEGWLSLWGEWGDLVVTAVRVGHLVAILYEKGDSDIHATRSSLTLRRYYFVACQYECASRIFHDGILTLEVHLRGYLNHVGEVISVCLSVCYREGIAFACDFHISELDICLSQGVSD